MSAEPLAGDGPGPGPGHPADSTRASARRLAAVRSVPPPPPTTPFVSPGRHAAPEDAAAAATDVAPTDAAPDDLTPHDAAPDELAPDGDAVRTTGDDAPSGQLLVPETVPPPPAPAPPTGPAAPEGPRAVTPTGLAPQEAPSSAPAAEPDETAAQHAARTVRATWAEVEPRVDQIAGWFAALFCSLVPDARALFPAQIVPPARHLLHSLVLPMSTVDRPEELRDMVGPLVREHRALGREAGQYEALGIALIGAMRRFGGSAWDAGVEHAWVRAFSLAAEPMESAARAATAAPATVDATVVGHRRVGWDLAVVHVAPDVPVPHRAGQYLSVEVAQRPRMWRPLSPATAPRPDGLLEFHVRAVEGGWVSRAIVAHAATGDRWRLGPAAGRLALDPNDPRDVLMVAGGTGGAPILALCEDMARWSRPRACTVFLGGRVPADLTVLDRLTDLAAERPWLSVTAVCEEDPLATDTEPGQLPDAVVRSGGWSEHDILLSGSPAMIRATTSALLADGVEIDHIRHDPF
jgi:NAD(P)H-flavin reductase/hemoglobin-like flavoprotein